MALSPHVLPGRGGNPLFLEQLLRNADGLEAGNIPGTVQGIVQARLDAIPDMDRRALQAVSILGQRFSLPAMMAVAGFDDYLPYNLLAAALIRPIDDGYLFGHALIREGAYGSLMSRRRRRGVGLSRRRHCPGGCFPP
jgi:predicted ATPase